MDSYPTRATISSIRPDSSNRPAESTPVNSRAVRRSAHDYRTTLMVLSLVAIAGCGRAGTPVTPPAMVDASARASTAYAPAECSDVGIGQVGAAVQSSSGYVLKSTGTALTPVRAGPESSEFARHDRRATYSYRAPSQLVVEFAAGSELSGATRRMVIGDQEWISATDIATVPSWVGPTQTDLSPNTVGNLLDASAEWSIGKDTDVPGSGGCILASNRYVANNLDAKGRGAVSEAYHRIAIRVDRATLLPIAVHDWSVIEPNLGGSSRWDATIEYTVPAPQDPPTSNAQPTSE